MTKAQKIMRVRQLTGAKVVDASAAIDDANGDIAKAIRLLLVRNQGRLGPAWKTIDLS